MKRALITGVTGQDGSYLAEFLLEKGYEVKPISCKHIANNLLPGSHVIQFVARFTESSGGVPRSTRAESLTSTTTPRLTNR